MKLKIAVIALVACNAMFAQSNVEVKETFWGASDQYKTKMEIPEKWKNESAVIIYKFENFEYHKSGNTVEFIRSFRKRVKLLDKASVDDYSKFSFKKSFKSSKGVGYTRKMAEAIVGVKVVKPDGTEIEIDVEKEAVEVDDETKIAISNLEVGDIIDYYYHGVEPFRSVLPYRFDPVEAILADEYPIMEFKLFFKSEKYFFVNFNTYNGAPALVEKPVARGNYISYELFADDIEKHEGTRWYYPLVEMPCYKFQVYFSPKGKLADKDKAFLPENYGQLKKTVTQDEILKYQALNYSIKTPNHVKSYLAAKKDLSQNERLTEGYYFLRHYFLIKFVEPYYLSEAGFSLWLDLSYTPLQHQNSFICFYSNFLKAEKIPFEIIVGTKRFDGNISDLLLEPNAIAIIKVLTKKPFYASFFGLHTSVNEFSALLEGTDAYFLSASKKKLDQIRVDKLPVSSHTDNEVNVTIGFKQKEGFETFEITSKTKRKGYTKAEDLNSRLIYTDYVLEDYDSFGKLYVNSFMSVPKMSRKQFEREEAAYIEKLKEQQKDYFKKSVEKDLGLEEVDDYTYKILDNGRFGLNSNFSYEESFTVKGDAFVKKAGPNYMVEIGKLIGGQIELTEKERNRTANIYFDYPRAFNYEIRFQIPEGYSVSGIEKLNKNVDNAAGAFISTATIEGNELVVTTSKQYKSIYEPISNWPLILAFLDEASQFTNEKVLLKKDLAAND